MQQVMVDWVMRRTVERAGAGIRWKITATISGLRLGTHPKYIHIHPDKD